MDTLHHITISNYITLNKVKVNRINLSYQLFGAPLHTAPIVLVNHALTGNSNVSGDDGWWSQLVGDDKVIDTRRYTVLAFNIPGNGYDGFLIENYKDFVARDIAQLFLTGLEKLNISEVFAIIGGSLGGGIAWEMASLKPNITKHLIPIAADWKSTDWLIANCQIQEQFLVNSSQPVHDARMHAMLTYRTPESFNTRFNRSLNIDLEIFNVESWLLHHGKKLQERFQLSSYKLMNQLLRTIAISGEDENPMNILKAIQSQITIIAVDSDLFFTADENKRTVNELKLIKSNVSYNEINSVHGHDAFFIEYDQLSTIISSIFNFEKKIKQ